MSDDDPVKGLLNRIQELERQLFVLGAGMVASEQYIEKLEAALEKIEKMCGRNDLVSRQIARIARRARERRPNGGGEHG